MHCELTSGSLSENVVYRAYVPVIFVYGSGTSSRKKPSYHKCCALVELTMPHKELRKSSQLIRHREFVLPQSSLKELACQQLAHGMDEQWSYHSSYSASVSSGQYSVEKSTVKQVQDLQSCQLQGVAYFTDLSEKEIERRRKIGAANKGKVPWTKGRKWSEGMVNLSLLIILTAVLQFSAVSCHFLSIRNVAFSCRAQEAHQAADC